MFPSPEPAARTARGERDPSTNSPRFTDAQRLWLLERDFDVREDEDETFRSEVRNELIAIRRLVTSRLNWIVGLFIGLLIAVVVALITAIISAGAGS